MECNFSAILTGFNQLPYLHRYACDCGGAEVKVFAAEVDQLVVQVTS